MLGLLVDTRSSSQRVSCMTYSVSVRHYSLGIRPSRHAVFPDPRLVAAIVDRVAFNAHIIEAGTQSYRLATSKTRSRQPAS